MFERTRSDLAKRLGSLIRRFENIAGRARALREESELAARLGLPDDKPAIVAAEIESKAWEQADFCGEAVTQLLVERAMPLIYKKSVGRAEAFADQCELILDGFDAARRAAKEAFQSRFGEPGQVNATYR